MRTKKIKRKTLAMALCVMLALGSLTGCEGKEAEAAAAEKAEKPEKAVFTEEDLKGLVTGIEDRYVLEGAKDIDWSYGVEYDKDVVVSVKEDSSKADLSKPGTYTVTYTVTVDVDKMTEYLEEADKSEAQEAGQEALDAEEEAPKPENTTDIVVDKEMTVVDKARAEKLAEKGEEVWTDRNEAYGKADEKAEEPKEEAETVETKEDVQQTGNKEATSGSAQASKPQQPSASASAPAPTPEPTPEPTPAPAPAPEPEQPVHQHNWVAETTTTQVWIEDSAAWDEPVYEMKTVCGCGATFDSFDGWNQHSIDGCMWGYSVKPVQTGSVHHDAAGHYESQTVNTGRRICSGCGAVQ